MSISFVPGSIFSESSPITTGPDQDSANQTQWTLNIGSVSGSTGISGLQIPIYVTVAGLLGAYIRYLYIGIGEFKKSFQELLDTFKDKYHVLLNALDDYNVHTRQTISPWPLDLGDYVFRRSARKFAKEVTRIEDDPNKMEHLQHYDRWQEKKDPDEKPSYDNEAKQKFIDMRRALWSVIRQAETEFDKQRFILGMEVNTHILTTVGSFFLGPLLAVMAWLLLSISGIDGTEINGVLTFALVSFAIGLTTKAIITRVVNFVGEKIGDESPSEKLASAPSVSVDPEQARAGQLLTVRGKGFHPNSRVNLQYEGNGSIINNSIESIQSSSKGEFDFRFRLQESLPKGPYTISVKDEDR